VLDYCRMVGDIGSNNQSNSLHRKYVL
jgi:hypothetical protein